MRTKSTRTAIRGQIRAGPKFGPRRHRLPHCSACGHNQFGHKEPHSHRVKALIGGPTVRCNLSNNNGRA